MKVEKKKNPQKIHRRKLAAAFANLKKLLKMFEDIGPNTKCFN